MRLSRIQRKNVEKMKVIEDWRAIDVEDALKTLLIGRDGLSEEDAEQRLREFGPNELVEKKGSNSRRAISQAVQ